MGGLWLKEWHNLRPFWYLVLFLFGADLLFVPLTDFPDQNLLTLQFDLISRNDWIEYSVIIFFTCYALTSGLLVREQDMDTIRFLDALPTSRTRIFIVKLLLAFVVLFSGPLVEALVSLGFHLLSRDSLNHGFHWPLIGAALFLHALQILVFLSVGLVLSFLRRFNWLLTALLVFTYILVHREFPEVEVINPLTLVRPVLEGYTWVIPWDAVKFQSCLAAVLLLSSWYLFQGAGFKISLALDRWRAHWPGRIALGCAGTLAVFGWIGLVGYLIWLEDPDTDDDAEPVYVDWRTHRVFADPYVFHIPANLESRAREMIDAAPEIHNTVRDFFQAESLTEIPVDATAPAGPHTAGLAFGKLIRLNLGALVSLSPAELKQTLGHETTHVYIESLSNRRMSQSFRYTRFLHEGLAEYLEHRFFGHEGDELDGLNLQACLVYQRKELELEDMFDNNRLTARHDANLVYSLGERFVAALVFRYGDRAPGNILRAMARDDAPKDLEGLTLWRDTFRAAGYNFDEVANNFYDLLDRDSERLKERISSIPRVYGSLEEEAGVLIIRPHLEFPFEGEIICRVRQHTDSAVDEYKELKPDEDGLFLVSKQQYPALQYQLGIRDPQTGHPIYQPWQYTTQER
ncbi:MAG: ABC transporter permease [Acidobacteriota bacterium]|nr:ABC transporter permease [Acidobacteriota bacterium]